MARRLLAFMGLCVAACGPGAGQAPGPEHTTRVDPAKIFVTPEFFRRGDTITIRTTFSAPQKGALGPVCGKDSTPCKASIVLRLHDIKDPDAGDPDYEATPSLQTSVDFMPQPDFGTPIEKTFESFAVPAQAASRIQMAVWRVSETGQPGPIGADGEITWIVTPHPVRLGGAMFKTDCATDVVCSYQRE